MLSVFLLFLSSITNAVLGMENIKKQKNVKSFSTYTPVHFHDSITIETMLALASEVGRCKKCSVDLDE